MHTWLEPTKLVRASCCTKVHKETTSSCVDFLFMMNTDNSFIHPHEKITGLCEIELISRIVLLQNRKSRKSRKTPRVARETSLHFSQRPLSHDVRPQSSTQPSRSEVTASWSVHDLLWNFVTTGNNSTSIVLFLFHYHTSTPNRVF